jgi:glycosyltransferase involved in cell wall biosynthesis
MNSLVSIVIPTYNRARDLERAIRSVLAQTYPHWEALIVDNHSADDTDILVERFKDSRIKLLKTHNNGVIAVSRNLGIKHAAGKYVAFLDSDDWWKPRKLEESLKYLHSGADLIYHDLFLVTRPAQRLFWRKARTRTLKSPIFNDLLGNGNALTTSSVLIRRNILEQLNGFSENPMLIACEDYDLWLRTARITESFARIPQTLGYYWLGSEDYWVGGRGGGAPERIIAYLEHFETIYPDAFEGSATSAYWRNYIKAKEYFRMRSYVMARKHLKMIRRRDIPFSVNVRICWILLLINLYGNSQNEV